MIKSTIVLLLTSCFLLVTVQMKLIYALSFIRHGAIYPKNDLYDGSKTKQFRGLLTGVGIRQQYNLGTYLKQTYITEQQITTTKFNPNHVEFFSSSYERTQQSANSFIYGLFPLQEGYTIPQQVSEDKLLPPFTPLQSDNLQIDQLQQSFALRYGFQPLQVRPLDTILDNCPNYAVLMAERITQISKAITVFEVQQRAQISKIKSIFNLTAEQTNVPTISDLYETILSDRYLGRQLPLSYSQDDQKNTRYIYEYYNTLVFDQNFAQILSTPAFRFLRSKLNDRVSKIHDKRLTYVFCHHSNILPLLTLLNLTSSECLAQKYKGNQADFVNCVFPPTFSANLIFQLHLDDSSQYFVKIKYNGQYANLCEKQQIGCQYKEFVQRVKDLQTEFEKQCDVAGREQNIIISEN